MAKNNLFKNLSDKPDAQKNWWQWLATTTFRWAVALVVVVVVSYLVMAGLFQTMLRAELQKNPEIIVDAIRAMQAKSQNQSSAENEKSTDQATTGDDQQTIAPSPAVNAIYKKIIADKRNGYLGNPNGNKIIVEFFDYNCPYCQRELAILKQWVASDPQVKIVLVELPILGQSSVDAAFVAILTYWRANKNDQKRLAAYQQFHEKTLLGARPLTKEKLQAIATAAGFSPDRITADDQKRAKQFLQNNIKLANQLRIEGTPSFIYNGLLLSGFSSAETLKKMTEQ
ncbi:MAG: DsbA family protein [Hydrotalea sp.]|nr:DsbA family protein [Hydrotalea sp.]